MSLTHTVAKNRHGNNSREKKENIVDGGGTMKLYKVYTPKQAAQLSGELYRAFILRGVWSVAQPTAQLLSALRSPLKITMTQP